MADLSVFDEFRIAEATSAFWRLIALDRAWTATARRADLDEDALRELGSVVEEMNALIGRTVEAAYQIVNIAGSAELPTSVPGDVLPDEGTRGLFETLLDQYGGVVGMAESAYNALNDNADVERARLDEQMAILRARGRIEGDLSRRFLCNLAKGLMAAGGVTIWVPPHAHAAASVTAGATMYAAQKCWELEPAPRPKQR